MMPTTLASSPIAFPSSSPPAPTAKRLRAHDEKQKASTRTKKFHASNTKLRAVGGFLIEDDDEDEGEEEDVAEPPLKRAMLEKGQAKKMPVFCGVIDDDTDLEVDDDEANTADIQNALMQDGITPPASQSDEEQRPSRLRNLHAILASHFGLKPPDFRAQTCAGKTVPIRLRQAATPTSYEHMVAARSRPAKQGRATREYYGVEIRKLVEAANLEIVAEERQRRKKRKQEEGAALRDAPMETTERESRRTLLWTEKYRARNFMDLVGDDTTNRQVLRWLKSWDPLVFPHAHAAKPNPKPKHMQKPGYNNNNNNANEQDGDKPHRNVLLLTGPPGLGKTTLAHVCARQAGYEVLEINASDERSRDVVKGRIRTALGTETVKSVGHGGDQGQKRNLDGHTKTKQMIRPMCVVVDEVDGVVTGSGGSGEGGFVKALIELLLLDLKNKYSATKQKKRTKNADGFRQMRPLVLICNDLYHPSLRPLRQSGLAEILRVGKPTVESVVTRLKSVFEKEGIRCEKDAARKLCEAAWGMREGGLEPTGRRGATEGTAEGDLRGVMVVGEWVAGRLRAAAGPAMTTPLLTSQWVERHILHDLAHGGGGVRSLGRRNAHDIVSRIFQEGGGFPKPGSSTLRPPSKVPSGETGQAKAAFGLGEQHRRYTTQRLAELIDASGEVDRVLTEVFSEWPTRDFNDDSFLTKPDLAYEWLHFHDACARRLIAGQEWELAPYLTQPALACHLLFASSRRHGTTWRDHEEQTAEQAPLPFTGPRADYFAHEAEKANRSALQALLSQLSPMLSRAFRRPEQLAIDFLPYLSRLVSPDVKPIIVAAPGSTGASVASVRRATEKRMVRRAADVLADLSVALVKGRIDDDGSGVRAQYVYRLEPDLDALAGFETGGKSMAAPPVRYAVRQVLDDELRKVLMGRANEARMARLRGGMPEGQEVPALVAEQVVAARLVAEGRMKVAGLPAVKKDFFGRAVVQKTGPLGKADEHARRLKEEGEKARAWVTFHEGLNNAVTKPISLGDFLSGL